MKIRDLQGLGPKSESMLKNIGIHTVQDFLSSDPFSLFAELKQNDKLVSLNLLYAMVGAQEQRHWKGVATDRRSEILMRLDDMRLVP